MGMDVYGKNPVDETGEYFRNNVWQWHPLWDYCTKVAPELCAPVSGHSNDGDGLNADKATALADVLDSMLKSGHTAEYKAAYDKHLASLPRSECKYCEGTGIRTDSVAIEMGMPSRKLEHEIAILVGREIGWCNSCQGEGKVDHFDLNYPFEVDNVRDFADFCRYSGGFSIC